MFSLVVIPCRQKLSIVHQTGKSYQMASKDKINNKIDKNCSQHNISTTLVLVIPEYPTTLPPMTIIFILTMVTSVVYRAVPVAVPVTVSSCLSPPQVYSQACAAVYAVRQWYI